MEPIHKFFNVALDLDALLTINIFLYSADKGVGNGVMSPSGRYGGAIYIELKIE